jgi:phosphatidylglycerophosphatase A
MIRIMAVSRASAAPQPGALSSLATVLATGFGSGYSPLAPGTAGSAVGLLLFWPLQGVGVAWQIAATVAVFFAGTAAATRVADRVGIEDPGIVVVDEIVGMWVTLLFLPMTAVTVAAAFVLFRVMDVFKPWPARALEALPKGWGIMADDVMAGVYANLLVRVVLLVFPAA